MKKILVATTAFIFILGSTFSFCLAGDSSTGQNPKKEILVSKKEKEEKIEKLEKKLKELREEKEKIEKEIKENEKELKELKEKKKKS